jgi:hypothetical protein
MSVFTRAPTSKRAGSKMPSHGLTAILPCNDLDASQAFYARLGFVCYAVHENYRILEDRKGRHLHLNRAVEDWLVPGRNPFGLYLYAENIDNLPRISLEKLSAMDRKTSRGACTYSRFPIPIKRSCGSAGRLRCDHRRPAE